MDFVQGSLAVESYRSSLDDSNFNYLTSRCCIWFESHIRSG
jgi:hypothetical protein